MFICYRLWIILRLLILDACRDETGSRGVGIGEEKQQGVITIASCSPAERSYKIEKVVEEEGSKGTRGGYDDPYADAVELRTIHRKRTWLKSEDLKNNMSEFIEVVEETFEKAEKPQSRMRLEELELSVEINGEGQVTLLGNGGKAGAKRAITLKFKRKED